MGNFYPSPSITQFFKKQPRGFERHHVVLKCTWWFWKTPRGFSESPAYLYVPRTLRCPPLCAASERSRRWCRRISGKNLSSPEKKILITKLEYFNRVFVGNVLRSSFDLLINIPDMNAPYFEENNFFSTKTGFSHTPAKKFSMRCYRRKSGSRFSGPEVLLYVRPGL